VIKDAMTGDFAFEAGEMILVDHGVWENLKISAALLSHFDLVFILIDKPDELLGKCVATPELN
jgi:DNA replicative helicase MCM subunit Mcm2 (Cdc46/Mcm family)